MLQSASVDLSQPSELICKLIETLKEERNNDQVIASAFSSAEALCSKCGIEAKLVQHRQWKLPRRLAASVVEESVGQRTEITTEGHFQRVFLPIMDSVIKELESWFSAQATAVMSRTQALTPNSSQEPLNESAFLYCGNNEDLSHELYQLKCLLERYDKNARWFPLMGHVGFGPISGTI